MSRFQGLDDKNNSTSWTNDQIDSIWAEYVFNKLEEQFEVIILSGYPEQSNAPNSGETIGDDFGVTNDNRYYFVRVRPVKTAGVIIPSPFNTKNIQEAKKIINMHPMAYIAVNKTIHPPAHGDIFLCRYTRKDRLGLALVKRTRSSGQKITTLENKRTMATLHNTQQPQRLGDAPPRRRRSSGSVSREGTRSDSVMLSEGFRGSDKNLASKATTFNSYYIIGDSQASHKSSKNLGAFMEDYIKDNNPSAEVYRTGWTGKSPQVLNNQPGGIVNGEFGFPHLVKQPEIIYLFLGGNGRGYRNRQYSLPLIDKILEVTPDSQIIWILPPPPANVNTSYVRVGPTQYVERRRAGDGIIEAVDGVESQLTIKDPYSAPSFAEKPETDELLGPYGNPDNVESDRVHVKGAIRETLLREMLLIE